MIKQRTTKQTNKNKRQTENKYRFTTYEVNYSIYAWIEINQSGWTYQEFRAETSKAKRGGGIQQGRWGTGKESSKNKRINQSNKEHQKALLEISPNRRSNAGDGGQRQSNNILLWTLGSIRTTILKSPRDRRRWDKSQVTYTILSSQWNDDYKFPKPVER